MASANEKNSGSGRNRRLRRRSSNPHRKGFGFELIVLHNPTLHSIQQVVPDLVLFDWSPSAVERNTLLVEGIRSWPSLLGKPILVFYTFLDDVPQRLLNEVTAFEVPVHLESVRRVLRDLLQDTEPGVPFDLDVSKRKVFMVHGHDDGARYSVCRFVEQIGFEAIVLHEQANQGRTHRKG